MQMRAAQWVARISEVFVFGENRTSLSDIPGVDHPLVDRMLIGIEANADFYHLPTIGEIRLGIAAGINLLKGMTSRVAHLQLHDVDGVGHEDDNVGSDGS